jgi:hypothetical protein
MPQQMELVQFNDPTNADLINEIRGRLGGDFANRVPAPTKANLDASINAMWNYQPALNAFMVELVNVLGGQVVRSLVWDNPLSFLKVGLLNMGESIEEVAVGLLKAKTYNAEAEYLEKMLFGREPSNVQTAFHKVNREEFYKVTVNESQLERAFLNEGGLAKLLGELTGAMYTSDQWDEYLQTTNTLKRYYDAEGFFRAMVPDISSEDSVDNDAKRFLRTIRSYSDRLPFISERYNARHMPRRTAKEDLVLITTTDAKAAMDVNALAGAFNLGNMDIQSRIITLPDEHVDIPGFQGILTSRQFFMIADKLMRQGATQNPAGLYSNFFFHHQELISASPFENAILLTSLEQTTITVQTYDIVGIGDFTLTELDTDPDTGYDVNTPVTVTAGAATVERGAAYLVATAAITSPADGPNGGVTLRVRGNSSPRTRVNQMGILLIGVDEASPVVNVIAAATSDNTFESELVLNVTGPQVYGSVGLSVDETPGVINNTRKPGITPAAGGPVGTVLTVNNGSWDQPDLTFAVQWTRDGVNITGATDHDYTTVTADGGHVIAAVITATKAGLTTGTATTNGVSITV